MSYEINSFDRDELRRLRNKVDGLTTNGLRLTNSADSIVIGPADPGEGPGAPPSGIPNNTGQYQGMVFQMVSQNQSGWGFVVATPLL